MSSFTNLFLKSKQSTSSTLPPPLERSNSSTIIGKNFKALFHDSTKTTQSPTEVENPLYLLLKEVKKNEKDEKLRKFIQQTIKDLITQFEFVVKNGEDVKKQKEVITVSKQICLNAGFLLNSRGERVEPVSFVQEYHSKDLTISDIAEYLFDEKIVPSNSHKKILNYIADELLLNLNNEIPVKKNCHPEKSTNAANLLKWVDRSDLTTLESENLERYLKELKSFTNLLDSFKADIQSKDEIRFLDLEKKEAIEKISKTFKTTENLAGQLHEINVCLNSSFNDDKPSQDLEENTFFCMRYDEMLNLFDQYTLGIEKKIKLLRDGVSPQKSEPKPVLKRHNSTASTSSLKKPELDQNKTPAFIFNKEVLTVADEKIRDLTISTFDRIKLLQKDIQFVGEKFDDQTQKSEVDQALKKIYRCFQTYLDDNRIFQPKHHRPGSVGLNIEEIQHLLVDTEKKTSKSHAAVKKEIGASLLNLKQEIPVLSKCKSKSTNTKVFLAWVKWDFLTESPVLNLYLFKKALMDFCQLISLADKKKSKPFNTSNEVKLQFAKINLGLKRSFGDEEIHDCEAEVRYYAMRREEIFQIFQHYIQNIEKLIAHLLTKDTRFSAYLSTIQSKKNSNKESQHLIEAFNAMPPVSPPSDKRLGKIGEELISSKTIDADEWLSILEIGFIFSIYEGGKEMLSKKDFKQEASEDLDKILDVMAACLNLGGKKALSVLKEYFIFEKYLDKNFDLKKFFEDLGFTHLFKLKPEQIIELQQILIEDANNWLKISSKTYVKENKQLETFLGSVCFALGLSKTTKHIGYPNKEVCLKFAEMGKVLHLAGQDETNTEKENFQKILNILSLIKKGFSHSYLLKTINPIFSSIVKENFASPIEHIEVSQETKTQKTVFETAGPAMKKNYEIIFEENCILINGIGYYSVTPESCYQKDYKQFLREELTLSISKDQIMNPTQWIESYRTTIYFKELPKGKLEDKINIFRILCHRHQIAYDIDTFM